MTVLTEASQQTVIAQSSNTSFHTELGGLSIRNTHEPRDSGKPYTQYTIPQGFSVDIPAQFPIARLRFPSAEIDMDTLRDMITSATSVHIPPEITIVISFPNEARQYPRIETSDPVATQIVQFYAETHPTSFTIHQHPDSPSIFIDDTPVRQPYMEINSAHLPVNTLIPMPSIDA